MTDDELKQKQNRVREILEKEGVEIGYNLSFPIYRILPNEVKLALLILDKYGMEVKIFLKSKK